MQKHISQSLAGWNCPKHGGFSTLTICAWPDCPHGIAENSVEADTPGLEKPETFHREAWHGLERDTFYDWRTTGLPSWFDINRPYGYFEGRLIQHATLDQMTHYTSAEGALAILQSGSLRFTDFAYLNDTREVTYGLDLMRSLLDADTDVANSRALSNLKKLIENEDPFSPYNIYTASFSSDPDSLSQ